MKQKLLWLVLPLLQPVLQAQTTLSWAADVAPILYDHCVSCHRVGGVGAFALETWTDAQLNADAMLQAVETRRMPPWRAEPAYRHFKDENYLSDSEIQTIAGWVNGGQMPGDLSQAPPLPNFQNGSQLSAVDMSLLTPQYTVAQNTDEYRAFVIPTGVSTDKFFNEIEILPGNDELIHHIVLYTDPTNEAVLRDQADPGPGFQTNGMVGNITQNAELIGEWTPGGTPIKLPPNFGYRIPKNGYFIVELHFAPGHLGQTDEGSAVNLHFSTNFNREVYYGVLTYADSTEGLLNPPFLIPANTKRTLIADLPTAWIAPVPLSVLSLTPHAHVVATSFKAYSYRPGFTDTIPLIHIPKWDFYWQGTYTLRKPLKLNTNRTTRAEVTYDNTVNNPENPHSPPQDVRWGEKTSDEMLYLFASVVTYQTGDENIILDSTLLVSVPEVISQDTNFLISPNPMDDALDIRARESLVGLADLLLTDLHGRTVRQWRERDLQHSRTSVRELAPGIYVLQIRQPGRVSTFKVVKQ